MAVAPAAFICLIVGIADGDRLTARREAQSDQPALSLLSSRDVSGRV
jgi:hypothetical protein